MAMLSALAGKAGSGLGAIGALGGEMLGLRTTGDLFAGILQSQTVEDDLINKFELQKLYGERHIEDARKKLASRTAISVDRKSEIIEIDVTDRSPQRSAAMGAEYVAELNRVVTNLNTSSAHRERVFLENRLAQVRQDLETAEKNFSQFASKNTAIDIQEQGKAMIEAAATLEGQLIATQTELESLRQIYTDNNVRVRATQARVDELKLQLQKIGGKTESGVATADSDQDAESMYPSIRQLPLLGVGYADLYRRMKVQEAVFETLTQEYELAKVEEAKETPSVKVLDPPRVPDKKSFPPRTLIVAGCTLLGFAFGISWVLGTARWEEIDPQDPGKLLTQEVFHSVSSYLHWTARNGSAQSPSDQSFWRRIAHRNRNPDVNAQKPEAKEP